MSGVGVMVGVNVAAGVGDRLGVTVQPGGKVGMFGRMEQPAMERTSQRLRRRRWYFFILFLYFQKTAASSKVVFELCVIYNRPSPIKLDIIGNNIQTPSRRFISSNLSV